MKIINIALFLWLYSVKIYSILISYLNVSLSSIFKYLIFYLLHLPTLIIWFMMTTNFTLDASFTTVYPPSHPEWLTNLLAQHPMTHSSSFSIIAVEKCIKVNVMPKTTWINSKWKSIGEFHSVTMHPHQRLSEQNARVGVVVKLNQIDRMTRVKHHQIDFSFFPPSHNSLLNRIARFRRIVVCLHARNKQIMLFAVSPSIVGEWEEMLLISTVCWLINKNRENEIIKHNSSRFALRKKNFLPHRTSLQPANTRRYEARIYNIETSNARVGW